MWKENWESIRNIVIHILFVLLYFILHVVLGFARTLIPRRQRNRERGRFLIRAWTVKPGLRHLNCRS